MTQKKRGTKKKLKKTSRKNASLKTNIKKAFAGLSILVFLVILAGFLAHHFILRKQPIQPMGQIPYHKAVFKGPVFEVYPEKELPSKKPITKPKIPVPHKLPDVAIIIDDMGYDRILAKKFLGLDAVLTFSMLPHGPFAESIAVDAHSKGAETMLHLPMEPNEYPAVNPGPGTLFVSMSPDQLISQLEKDLDDFPFIKGVNNHMGSRMTTVSTQMYQIFSVLKKRELFFIDSRTTPDSICKPSARMLQVPFAERNVFIDHIQEPDFIRKQIKQLIRIAHSNGEAIGIAHPHSETYNVLRELLPDLKKKVNLVPASRLVRISG